jgi:hypothetical protein
MRERAGEWVKKFENYFPLRKREFKRGFAPLR